MKMASRSTHLISKKPNCTYGTLFFLISKKNKFARAARTFVFLCRCFARLQRCFVRLKFPSYTLFLWRNCRMCLPNILFPVFMFSFSFHWPSFTPCWPLRSGRQQFSFSHRLFEFSCFSTKFVSLALALSLSST